MMPESNESYDFSCDMWAAGVVVYEMLTGRLPFTGASKAEIFAKVMKQDPDFTQWETISLEAKDLIKSLLVKDPKS